MSEYLNKAFETIDNLFDYYQKGYIDINELDRRCNKTMNLLFRNIYHNTNLSTPEITDYISDIKIRTYSELAKFYKKRTEERKIN